MQFEMLLLLLNFLFLYQNKAQRATDVFDVSTWGGSGQFKPP